MQSLFFNFACIRANFVKARFRFYLFNFVYSVYRQDEITEEQITAGKSHECLENPFTFCFGTLSTQIIRSEGVHYRCINEYNEKHVCIEPLSILIHARRNDAARQIESV